MLVTLRKEDLVLHLFNDDIEKFEADREKNNFKRKTYLPSIRQAIFSKFEEFFGVSENQLLENFSLNGEKIDKRFLQLHVGNAVKAFFYKKVEPKEIVIGEFQKITDDSEGEFYLMIIFSVNNNF